MKCFVILALCLNLINAEGENVVTLTDDNFDSLTNSGSWLIEFFAPWCSHCKQFAPVYSLAADKLKGTLSLGAVDCTVNRGLQDRFEIKSFPTLKFWREGENRTYRGGRTADALVDFGRAMMAPPVEKVTGKNLSQVLTDNPVTFLYLGEKGPQYRVFHEIAFKLQGQAKFVAEDAAFVDDVKNAVKDKKIYKEIDIKESETPVVVELSRGGDKEKFKGGVWTLEKLRNFVLDHKLPLLSEVSGTNFDDVTTTGKWTVFAITSKDDPLTSKYLDELVHYAKLYKDEFVFANIDWAQYKDYAERFGFKATDIPTVFVLNAPDEYYWLPKSRHGSLNVQAKEQQTFLDEVLSGIIQPTNVHPWYSPTRYTKWLTKNLTDTHLIILVVVTSVGFAILLIAGCIWAGNDLEPSARPPPKKSGKNTKDH